VQGLSIVESVQNSMVKHAHSLTVPKKLREAEDFLCEGFHLLREALQSDLKIRYVLATKEAAEKPEGRELAALANRNKVRWVTTLDNIIQYLSDTAAPQGLVAVVKKPENRWPLEPVSLVLCVHGVQDPGNLGNLLRTAEAAGVSGVLFTEGCCDPFNPKAVRAAMGSLFRVPFQADVTWKDSMAWLGERKVRNLALMPRAEQTINQTQGGPVAFWVGAEGEGLPNDLSVACDGRVRIPMLGPVESLNVGTAAALALFYKSIQTPVP
jgi:TrmH family RNA methyltransferase